MTTINLNQSPYFDDFSENKKFYQILFRPGRAVQARELNQIQTQIKSQIDRFGKHIFQNGSLVLNFAKKGEAIKVINNTGYILVESSGSAKTTSNEEIETYWVGKTITNVGGVSAVVVGYKPVDANGLVRLFLQYTFADTTGLQLSFSEGQSVSTVESDIALTLTATISVNEFSVGTIQSVKIESGVYFYNGRFILVDEQTVFVTPIQSQLGNPEYWNVRPTARIGLKFVESIVSWTDDESLLDNATGTPNIGGPGADRLHIDAQAMQIDLNFDEENFVELVKIVDGSVRLREPETRYGELDKTLAARTFDESGDYTVIPFQIQIKDFLSEGGKNGGHSISEFIYATQAEAQLASVSVFGLEVPAAASYGGGWVPGNTSAEFFEMARSRLSVVVDPGRAYVKGFRIEKASTAVVDFKKARTTKFRNNKVVDAPLGSYIFVKNMYGELRPETYDNIDLYDQPIVTSGTQSGTKIGTARVLALQFYSGFRETNTSVDNRVYQLFLFNVQMIGDGKFEKVKSIYSNNPTFTCDVQLDRYRLTGTVAKPQRPFTLTGTITAGTNVVTGLSSTANIKVGMSVTSTTSTSTVTVQAILSATEIRLSGAGGGTTGSATRLIFYPVETSAPTFSTTGNTTSAANTITNIPSTTNIKVGMQVISTSATTCILNDTFVTAITSSTAITVSNNSGATLTGTGLIFADVNCVIGTGTVWRNDPQEILSAGDYIEVNPGQSNSKIYKVFDNPPTDTILRITSNNPLLDSWPDGSNVDYLYTILRTNSTNAGLVYKLPDEFVATVRSTTSDGSPDDTYVDTSYTVRRTDYNVAATANQLSLSAASGTQFENFSTTNYAVINESTNDWLQVLPYSSATTPTAGTCYVNAQLSSLTIVLPTGTTGTFQVHSTIRKPGGLISTPSGAAAKERIKNLVKGSFNGSGDYVGTGWAVSSGADVNEISLGKPDVLRITRIVESPAFSTAPSSNSTLPTGHNDITGLYILDNGQRDYYYDIAKVTLRPGSERPRGQVRVEFDFFQHNTTTGDYFSVNSYPFSGSTPDMDYSEIPEYVASDGTSYSLSDCLDFRPVVNSGGIDSGFATVMGIPKDNVACDYHFYLPRRDKLVLDYLGNFYVKSGIPNEAPVFPEDPDNGMTLYEIDLQPYTASFRNVFPKMRENKRYTMRDIGKLETRIKNLEYYTSLSLLEKETSTLTIQDAAGLDRFKNGFLVDNFKSFASSDLGTPDYRCSLDRATGVMRPIIREDAVRLSEKALLQSSESSIANFRTNKNYQKTGDLYTLPYTNVEMVAQTKASHSISVNPSNVAVYLGNVSITPWTDEWRDVKIADALNVEDSGLWDATRASFGADGTRVDYQTTFNNWISSSTNTQKTGAEVMLQAGHGVQEKLGISDRKWKQMMSQNLMVEVPPGYANSGQLVPIGRKSYVADQTRTTTTLSGKEITTSFVSSFKDAGFSAPVSMGSRIIDTSLIEYIRSREIVFTGKTFRPGARVYPFFDGVDVSAYCKPKNISTGVYGSNGSALICDGRGRVEGIFTIPNNTTIRFKTGDRFFRLTTSPGNVLVPSPDSAGQVKYTARGWIDTKQETTYSTRTFTISQNKVETEKDISIVSSEVLGSTDPCPRDPVAQSFYVYEKAGCFITAVDVFFSKKPTGDFQPPVALHIREMGDQGQPSIRILPFSEVLKESPDVVVNDVGSSKMTITGNLGQDSSIPAVPETTGPWINGEVVSKTLISGTLTASTSSQTITSSSPSFSSTATPIGSSIYVGSTFVGIVASVTSSTQIALKSNAVAAFNAASPINVYKSTDARSNGSEFEHLGDAIAQMVPTRFTFESPVYLRGGKNYCFVLISDSNDYEIWYSLFGPDLTKKEEDQEASVEIGTTDKTITDNFIQGSFFKSQSGFSWMEMDNHDAKFKIWKAQFDTSVSAEIDFVNDELDLRALTSDPVEFVTGSSEVRILHPNHGHTTERASPAVGLSSKVVFSPIYDKTLSGTLSANLTSVTISGGTFSGLVANSFIRHPVTGEQKRVVGTPGSTSLTIASKFNTDFTNLSGFVATTYGVPTGTDFGGVVDAETFYDYRGYDVKRTELDYYIIDLKQRNATFSTASIVSGKFGGSKILATENKRYEEMTLITTPLEVQETSINWYAQTTSGCGVHDSTTSTYVMFPSKTEINGKYVYTNPVEFLPNERLVFNNPMLIGSYINELPPSGSTTDPSNQTISGPSTIVSETEIGDRKSINVRAVLKSSNADVSPALDESRMTAYLVSHRLDNPRGVSDTGVDSASIINSTYDNYQVVPTAVSPAATTGSLYFSYSSTTATGSISGTANSTRITGTGTKFLSELRVGDVVKTDQNDRRTVTSVISDSEFLVDIALSATPGTTLYINPKNTVIKTAVASVAKHLSNLDVGKYITISGAKSSGSLTRNITSQNKAKVVRVNYTPTNTTTDSDLGSPKLIEVEVDFKTLYNPAANLEAGTITTSGTSPYTVTGVSTSFASILVGLQLYNSSGALIGTVASVASTTSLNLAAAPLVSVSGGGYYRSENVSAVTITQLDRYIDEISPINGSCGSKYVSKILSLGRPSNALKIMFDGSRDSTCEFELYYKIKPENSIDPMDTINWIKTDFNVEVNGQLVNATPAANLFSGDFSEYSSTINNLPAFSSIQAKLVMRGGNPARAPRVANFRLIALDE